jgi:hypothetical protein
MLSDPEEKKQQQKEANDAKADADLNKDGEGTSA